MVRPQLESLLIPRADSRQRCCIIQSGFAIAYPLERIRRGVRGLETHYQELIKFRPGLVQ